MIEIFSSLFFPLMYFQSSNLLAISNDNFLTPIYSSIPNPMWSGVLVTQLCPTLCDPMDHSTPSSSVRGVFQTRILQWVAILFSKGSFWPRDQTLVSCISGRFLTVWTTRETQPYISSVQFSHSVMSDSLRPHELQHARPPCPSPTPGVQSDSSSQWCHSAISSSVIPFSSCPQSLPASVFSNESTLRMRWPKYNPI